MRNSVVPKAFARCITLLLIPAALLNSCKRPENRPNILVIFTDDQTWQGIGYNNPEVKTPILDELAAEGIIFSHNYTASPICTASRAAMMTGMFPQQNGTVALNTDQFVNTYSRDTTLITLPRLFNRAGYETWFAGKSHLGPPEDYGFRKGQITREYNDTAAFRLALDYIRTYGKGDRPFFFWLAPRQPHVPLHPAEKWLEMYDTAEISLGPNFRESPEMLSMYNQGLPGEIFFRDSKYTDNWKNLPAGPPRSAGVIKDYTKAYYATISHLDHQVGVLMDALEEKGLARNTVIIFLSDNGYFLGHHGLGNKLTMHEESVRVPLFIHWSGLKNKGVRCDELVSSLDVIPTVLELAGIRVPDNVMGSSLVPLLDDPATPIHDWVASESVGVGGARGQGHRMVRNKQWKYILTGVNEEALFEETADPAELDNLVLKEPATADQMRRLMIEWMNQTGDRHRRPPVHE